MTEIKEKSIREINDEFRGGNPSYGMYVCTRGVEELPEHDKSILFQLVRSFNDFSENNDPYGEHDFGIVQLGYTDYFWKIDYYDTNYEYGSPDPSDITKTRRVLTIMRADEY